VNRRLLFITTCLSLFLPSVVSYASSGSIVQVSHRLQMSSKEPVPPKDFYIDLGMNDGVKEGDVFSVYRTVNVVNMVNGYSPNLMRVPLGELKIFLVGEYTSIARMANRIAEADLPVLDYPDFMLGDVVDLKSNLPFKQ
jgi:hypothetical protein